MRVVIKGAGDIASGVAMCLFYAGMQVTMTDLQEPTAIRRTVAFSPAIKEGSARVENVTAYLAKDAVDAARIMEKGYIALLTDERASCIGQLRPTAVVDAILAKRNLHTSLSDAQVVVGLGPGFHAGKDCHAVIETQRGHNLGRILLVGSAAENTGIPGDVGGYTSERVLRAPCSGIFQARKKIGDQVIAGETVAYVDGREIRSEINGILRGILPDGILVTFNMKCGDVDPRCDQSHCWSVSDKARAIGGSVLTAILLLSTNVPLHSSVCTSGKRCDT